MYICFAANLPFYLLTMLLKQESFVVMMQTQQVYEEVADVRRQRVASVARCARQQKLWEEYISNTRTATALIEASAYMLSDFDTA